MKVKKLIKLRNEITKFFELSGHPKLRLFITHGGLLSTMEATYHGVPLLGLPLFADQFSNMRQAESEGWGRMMKWKDLNETTFTKAISEILYNTGLVLLLT